MAIVALTRYNYNCDKIKEEFGGVRGGRKPIIQDHHLPGSVVSGKLEDCLVKDRVSVDVDMLWDC